jgi:DNA-binding response OmpR family regulator
MADEQPTQETQNNPVILLVEDDPLLTRMYQSKFNAEGFKVLSAQDGVTGLKMAQEEKVDFMVLDIMMPQMSGIDLLEKLRTGSQGKDTPVIVLTNLTEKEEEEKARKLGVKEYLLKANLTPGEVVEKIKKYLGKS